MMTSKHKFLTLGDSLAPQRQWCVFGISRTEQKILPGLLLTKTGREPASALTCNQRKTKWPQRPLQVLEEHWASYQKMGSAQYKWGVWVSLSGLRSLVIISVKQDGYARGPQGSKCFRRVCDPQALPSCFPPLFPSTTVWRHRALSQGGCFFEFTVRQDIEGLMWPRNWRAKPLTWIKSREADLQYGTGWKKIGHELRESNKRTRDI